MSITDVYGSPAPSKSRHYTEPEPLLSEDDVRQRMSDIARRYDSERQALRDAYARLAKKQARAHLATKFLQPDLLTHPEAKEYLVKALAEKTKMHAPDIEAILDIELEGVKMEYDLAKFDCETSDKDYAKLEPQLNFYMALMKLR